MNTATELLRRALETWDDNEPNDFNDCMEEIRAFLAAEPEADGPVGYVYTDFESGMKQGAIDDHSLANGTPLYTRPEPARKPMTSREALSEFLKVPGNGPYKAKIFFEGVRFAERHHGIGGDVTETDFGNIAEKRKGQVLTEEEVVAILKKCLK